MFFSPPKIKLRNRYVNIYNQDVQSKFPIITFSYEYNFLKGFKCDVFNLNYNPFFKEITTNIYKISTSVINRRANFNLTSKTKRQWFATCIIYLDSYYICKLNILKWFVNYYYFTNFDFINYIRENINILAISCNI